VPSERAFALEGFSLFKNAGISRRDLADSRSLRRLLAVIIP